MLSYSLEVQNRVTMACLKLESYLGKSFSKTTVSSTFERRPVVKLKLRKL